MVKGFRNGLMEHFMMDFGKTIRLMERVSFIIQMEWFIKVYGRTIEPMDMEY